METDPTLRRLMQRFDAMERRFDGIDERLDETNRRLSAFHEDVVRASRYSGSNSDITQPTIAEEEVVPGHHFGAPVSGRASSVVNITTARPSAPI